MLAWALSLGLGSSGVVSATGINPVLKGSWPGFARGRAQSVAVSGSHTFVGAGLGLQVIDTSDPAKPQRVGGCDTPGYAVGVAVSGNYA